MSRVHHDGVTPRVAQPPQPPQPPVPLQPLDAPWIKRQALPSGMPAGAIIAFAGQVIGQGATDPLSTATELYGWMVCDGRALHRAQYPELFAAIGYRYRTTVNDPSYLFRIPNLEGYFLRGVQSGDAAANQRVDPEVEDRTTPAGTKAVAPYVGSIQQPAFQSHEHQYVLPQAAGTSPGNAGPVSVVTPNANQVTNGIVATTGSTEPVRTSKYETRSVNVAVYYLIRLTSAAYTSPSPFAMPPLER